MPAISAEHFNKTYLRPRKLRKPNPKTTRKLRNKLAALRARNAAPLAPRR